MLSASECTELYDILGMVRLWRLPTIRINNTTILYDFSLLDIKQLIDNEEQPTWSYDIPSICFNSVNNDYQRIFDLQTRTVCKLVENTYEKTSATRHDIQMLRSIYNQISQLSTFSYMTISN